ncbi:hypothetical protein PR048_015725, partial [Dryococelus australis]
MSHLETNQPTLTIDLLYCTAIIVLLRTRTISDLQCICLPPPPPPVIQEGRVHHTQIFSCKTYTECWGFNSFFYRTTKNS